MDPLLAARYAICMIAFPLNSIITFVLIVADPSRRYRQGPSNDLQYWGLDYPPLTAFHSFLMGKMYDTISIENDFSLKAGSFRVFLPEMVQINSSRGFESPPSKLLMRLSVLAGDLLVFFPAGSNFPGSVLVPLADHLCAVYFFVFRAYYKALPSNQKVRFTDATECVAHNHLGGGALVIGSAQSNSISG